MTARVLRCAAAFVAAGPVIAAVAPAATAAEKPWIEVKTPHFVVVANTGEGTARDIGWQFEQVHRVFETLWTWAHRESGRAFVIFAVRNEADMKALAPKFWERGGEGAATVAVSAPDKDYVALRAQVALPDKLRSNPYFFAYWGYATSLLDASFPDGLPPWYKRGVADLFGNTLVRGKDVHVGRLIEHHLELLARPPHLSLTNVLNADWKSKYLTDDDARRSFDAHAWLFVHYLAFGEKGARREQLNRFATLLRTGKAADVAFREALGDPQALADSFGVYMSNRLYGYVAVKADLNVKGEGFALRPLTNADAAARRAGFHAAMGRPVDARALLDEARRTEPQSALASEVEAVMLDRDGKQVEALAAYARAADAGSENFYVHYRRGVLLRRPDAPKDVAAQVAKSLDQAVRLNPDHAWAQASLARALAEVEPGERSVAAANQAIALEPGEPAHRLALVKALWEASRRDEARSAVLAARSLAKDEDDRKEVQEWLDFMDRAGTTPQRPASAAGPETAATASGSTNDWAPAAAKACEAGTAGACAALASAYESGNGVPKDPARALSLYEKACDLSELRACAYAASLKFPAGDLPKDVAGATRLASKACDGGTLVGCTTLAFILMNSPTPQDPARVRALLEKACSGGEPNACQLLKKQKR